MIGLVVPPSNPSRFLERALYTEFLRPNIGLANARQRSTQSANVIIEKQKWQHSIIEENAIGTIWKTYMAYIEELLIAASLLSSKLSMSLSLLKTCLISLS